MTITSKRPRSVFKRLRDSRLVKIDPTDVEAVAWVKARIACCASPSRSATKFGGKPKLPDYRRKEALRRRAAGDETSAVAAKSCAVDIGMISRFKA